MVVHTVVVQSERCTSCEKEPGRWQRDPYLEELHDDVGLYFICDDCAEERRMDV